MKHFFFKKGAFLQFWFNFLIGIVLVITEAGAQGIPRALLELGR